MTRRVCTGESLTVSRVDLPETRRYSPESFWEFETLLWDDENSIFPISVTIENTTQDAQKGRQQGRRRRKHRRRSPWLR